MYHSFGQLTHYWGYFTSVEVHPFKAYPKLLTNQGIKGFDPLLQSTLDKKEDRNPLLTKQNPITGGPYNASENKVGSLKWHPTIPQLRG